MANRFTQRLARLIRADAHGIIESLEDRALLLKQHLREAELELQRKRARIATLDEEAQRLAEEAARLDRAALRLDEDARLALAGGRDDLARFALRKLLPLRREAEERRERIVAVQAERERLAPTLAEQEEAFEPLRQRVREQLAADARPARAPVAAADAVAAEEEVELELLRRAQSAGASR